MSELQVFFFTVKLDWMFFLLLIYFGLCSLFKEVNLIYIFRMKQLDFKPHIVNIDKCDVLYRNVYIFNKLFILFTFRKCYIDCWKWENRICGDSAIKSAKIFCAGNYFQTKYRLSWRCDSSIAEWHLIVIWLLRLKTQGF